MRADVAHVVLQLDLRAHLAVGVMQHRALLALTEGRAAAGVSEAAAPTAVVVEVQPVQADNAAIANDDAVDLQLSLIHI